jgi:hypothetical protein
VNEAYVGAERDEKHAYKHYKEEGVAHLGRMQVDEQWTDH